MPLRTANTKAWVLNGLKFIYESIYILQGSLKRAFIIFGILTFQKESEGLNIPRNWSWHSEIALFLEESAQGETHPPFMPLWTSQSCFSGELTPPTTPELFPTLLLRKSLNKCIFSSSLSSISIKLTIIIEHFLSTYYMPDMHHTISFSLLLHYHYDPYTINEGTVA